MKRIEPEESGELRANYDLRTLRVRKLGSGRKSFGGTVPVEHDAQGKPRTIVIPAREELLEAARSRVSLPPGELWLDYQDDVDTLYVSLKKNAKPTHSETNTDDSMIYDYENDTLVGIEILDISGQLKYANPSSTPLCSPATEREPTVPLLII